MAAHLDQLARYVVGWDATEIKHFTDAMYNDFAARRGAMEYYSAISGVEQALWDVAGKRLGVPVHQPHRRLPPRWKRRVPSPSTSNGTRIH